MRLFVTACLLAMIGLAGCKPTVTISSQEVDTANPASPEMPSPDTNVEAGDDLPVELSEVLKQVTEGTAVLVDVRSDDEWNESHFAQAQHICIDKINEDVAAACAGLDKAQPVFLH